MDGLQLKKDPVTALNKLQKYLQVPFIDYKSKLMFDSRKGFFCAVVNGKKKVIYIFYSDSVWWMQLMIIKG